MMRLIARKSKRGSGFLVGSIEKRPVIIGAGAGAFKGRPAIGAVTSPKIDRDVDWFAFPWSSQAARGRLSNGARTLHRTCVIVAAAYFTRRPHCERAGVVVRTGEIGTVRLLR